MNTRRHNATKRWAPGASFLLATALLLLVLSPGAHAAAALNGTQGDAVFWLLREMQDEARSVVSAIPLQDVALENGAPRNPSDVSLASTRAIENAAQHLSEARKTGASTLHFAPQIARDLSVQIVPREVSASQKNASHHLAHRLAATSSVALARVTQAAPRVFIPPVLREYSRQLHSAAYLSGVRSNSFPQ